MSDRKRVLRIHVMEGDKDKVDVRVPLGIAKLAGLGGIADKLSKEQGNQLRRDPPRDRRDARRQDRCVIDETKGDHVEILSRRL